MTEDEDQELRDRYGLTYHVTFSSHCQKLVGFEGKDVLEVGGSLTEQYVFDRLKPKSWVSVESPDYDLALSGTGDGNQSRLSTSQYQDPYKRYHSFQQNIEDLPPYLYSRFDLVFSIAAFEHIQNLPEALTRMFLALRPGGKMFALFSPVWSAHDGHHLPHVTDLSGNEYSFDNSPIPAWGHLLLRPAEMLQHLSTKTDKETARKMVYWIYQSPHINRLFTEDYLAYVDQSHFTVDRIDPVFNERMDPQVRAELERLHPGRKQFQNNGLLMILSKSKRDPKS